MLTVLEEVSVILQATNGTDVSTVIRVPWNDKTLIKRATDANDFEERYSRYAIFGLCKTCSRKQRKSANLNQQERLQTAVVRDALELTLAIERRGYTFYTNASRKTKNGRGRLMFQRLAAEEAGNEAG